MKIALIVLAVFVGSQTMAAGRKPAAAAPATSTTYRSASYNSSPESTVTPSLGFVRGAINLGAQYEKAMDGYAAGGYFFMQMDKEKSGVKNPNQVMSFGGQIKAHVLQNSNIDTYIAPGFGLHMIKDVADASSSSGKTDVTAFGPTLRIGALMPISGNMSVGLDRLEIWNWFDDKAPTSQAFYSAAMTFQF